MYRMLPIAVLAVLEPHVPRSGGVWVNTAARTATQNNRELSLTLLK
jgi:hypothetical protein